MPDQRTIENNLIKNVITYTDKLTFFGFNSVIRGICKAFSIVFEEVWHLYETKAKWFFLTSATGDALDNLGEERDIPRAGASFSSVPMVFRPAAQTIINWQVDNPSAGNTKITVADGSKFLSGATIKLRRKYSANPTTDPVNEEKTISSKPTTNEIVISNTTNSFAIDDFIQLKVTVPEGTEVRSSNGISFKTTQSITVGQNNLSMLNESISAKITDKVIAICQTEGKSGDVAAFAVNKLISVVNGIDSVFNPVPGKGGEPYEIDGLYKTRIQRFGSGFNADTQTFYYENLRDINKNVARVFWELHPTDLRKVKLHVFQKSGSNFTAGELTELQDGMNQRVHGCETVQVVNGTFTSCEFHAKVTLKKGYSLQNVFASVAQRISEKLDWSIWPAETAVDLSDIITIIDQTEGVDNTDMVSPTADITVAELSMPRFMSLTLEELGNTNNVIHGTLTQTLP